MRRKSARSEKIDKLVAHIGKENLTQDPLDLMNWVMSGTSIDPNDMNSLKRIAVICELCTHLLPKTKV